MKKLPQPSVAIAMVLLQIAPLLAAPIPGLFPTGVSGAGTLLPAGSPDPHYILLESADPGDPGPAARVVNEGFPIDPWLANGPSSKWIAPTAAQAGGSAAGNYVYQLSFDLAGLQPGTASISGQWSCDNAGTSILLNGAPTGNSNSGNFTAFEPFSINEGFVSGINTLEFVVNNAGDSANPTGLRVELSGAAEIEPPAGTPPSIQSDPEDITVLIGGSVSFQVAATGASPLSYQWRRNGVDLSGAESATLSIGAVTPADAGAYSVTVTNPWGDVMSAPAQLEISLDYPTEEELEREPLGPSRRRSGLAISEIMYYPRARSDGRLLEFIEIYNSNPWPEPLAGYRIDGEIDFTFPPGAKIAANGFVLVAASPTDIAAEYGTAGVLGPWAGSLPDSNGSLRLIKRSGGVIIDLEYRDDPPWPVAADGAGHSLVLARASYGESDPRAWSKSARIGGNPGGVEAPPSAALDHVLINEIRANPAGAETDFIELYNRSFAVIDISNCVLSDSPSADLFPIPAGTVIPAGGFVQFTSDELGFGLSTSGETVYFKNQAGSRVIDSLRFGAQSPGSSYGRAPDGHPSNLVELSTPTAGGSNSDPAEHPVIINEIMFNPIHPDASEFIEIHNRGTGAIDIGGWAFTSGIDYRFPPGVILPPGGFAVVAKNRAQLLSDHPGLGGAIVFGDFGGSLSNRGESIELSRPIDLAGGGIAFATVDAVSYSDALGNTDGGGSSLELIDPGADNRASANWASSDESEKAPWTPIEHSGVLEHGKGTADQLQLFLLGAGAAQIDDVELIPDGGGNQISNSDFSDTGDWFFQGTHEPSEISGGVLNLRATKRGDLGANRIRARLSAALASGTRATIRARARWQGGSPDLLLRLLGNYLEVPALLDVPRDLGTPGAPNSQLVSNAPPVIESVRHRPVLPAANEAVRITARASDPDGLTSMRLDYRLDPSATTRQIAMRDDGSAGDLVADDGIYTAVIPGQVGGTLVAFRIHAEDGDGAAAQFPAKPGAEALVRWGDGAYAEGFATYRMWMTQETREIWSGREKMSNQPLDVTFVYADHRVVYGAGAHFSGSAYTSPGYDSPTGRICGYDLSFPRDSMVLGDDRLTLDFPVRDPTAQREQLMYWFCDQFDLPNNYRRYVNLFVNGIGQRQRGGWGTNSNAIYTDIQQPNADSVREWFPDGTGGHLLKG
ncbi:MAG: lamin tail domain-containing protein, partial [Verrucomicrobiales bacterium]